MLAEAFATYGRWAVLAIAAGIAIGMIIRSIARHPDDAPYPHENFPEGHP